MFEFSKSLLGLEALLVLFAFTWVLLLIFARFSMLDGGLCFLDHIKTIPIPTRAITPAKILKTIAKAL